MGVVVWLLFVKGMTLFFVFYGGSLVIVVGIVIGMLLVLMCIWL